MAQMPRFDTLWIRRELRRCAQASALLRVHLQFPDEDILDISAHLQRADKGMTLRPGELYAIVRFIRTCARVRKFLGHCDEEMEELRELRDALIDEHRLEKEVARCISQDGDVFDHASAQLASLRQRRGELSAMISEEARRFISAHKDILMDTITAIRGGRTCVLVKVSEKNSTRGIVHGESASGQAVYLEPGALVSLNNRLQALESEEQQEVERILSGLSAKVREEADELSANLDTMTLLDVIFAKAAWCNANDGCVASLNTQDAHLLLKEARHPLIPAASVVANTYEMREPRRRLLISGSNTGGKTVTLKTIALFVILTHAGFPVLCERAIVPFYQRILLDVGDQQSIQESLSTFSSHLSRLARICELADARSFIILDELGSGTDPAEGECLAIAIWRSSAAGTARSSLPRFCAREDLRGGMRRYDGLLRRFRHGDDDADLSLSGRGQRTVQRLCHRPPLSSQRGDRGPRAAAEAGRAERGSIGDGAAGTAAAAGERGEGTPACPSG